MAAGGSMGESKLVDLSRMPFSQVVEVADEVLRESLARHLATGPAGHRWNKSDCPEPGYDDQ
ncbi:hypothetical protein Aple_059620 [Acrocarpospora pleiomorpha]|uniref:FXSXX-COOH protein n=2 Tax=Acrocarpospora pleiomorpha TaxID=90975 RepID=A0A5M3XUS3_9ACTN|nr:hypothetical protein Aple_059620 [Acrocarpospora pleiomorpha]